MNEQDRKDLLKYRISRANETIDEVILLMENELWITAVNRLYYACYYAVSALLISKEIKASTHSGVRQMFGLHYIKTGIINKELGKFYSDIFDMRQAGDYEDYIKYSEGDLSDLFPTAKQLILEIENVLDLT